MPCASAFLTSDCEIPNCLAIAAGLTPALKAARTAFSLPVVNEPPPYSAASWCRCGFALAAGFSFAIRFLTTRGQKTTAIITILRRIAPALRMPDGVRFVLSDEHPRPRRFSPTLLFHGDLRWITPMLWLAYIFSSMTAFFLATWTPLVYEALQFSRAEAALAGSITAIGGALGGLALMRFTDTRGAIAVAAMPALAIPLLLISGFVDFSHAAFLMVIGLLAFALIGGHLGMNSIAGIFYPTAWRANGAGWATSVGKVGSIAGPFLGGMILATSLPIRNVFTVMAVCPAMQLVCLLVIV